jgi:hypothetical protein
MSAAARTNRKKAILKGKRAADDVEVPWSLLDPVRCYLA